MRRVGSSPLTVELETSLQNPLTNSNHELSHVSQMLVAGRPITFGTEGNYGSWAVHGWSQDKDQSDITWLDGHVASLEFVMAVPPTDLLLVVRMMPLSIEGPRQQQLYIYLNGLFVDLWTPAAKEFREYSTLLRKTFFSKESINLLTLAAPNAISPAESGLGPDQRTLSFAIMQVRLQNPTRISRPA